MIEIKNLTKVYKTSLNKSTTAIDDISLVLPHTGMVFIVGKSGSGKSTLLNMIGTLDNITSGDILIDGTSIKKSSQVKLQEYRSSYLGFIFQDFLLLNEFTVRENISLALKISGSEDSTLIDKVLEQVDLSKEAEKFPTELSGGQRQRVAIARALVKNPKLLLCDEPTGNLDYKTSDSILKFLKEQSKTKLVIIVSHNLEDAEHYADRIIELFDGKVVSDKSKNPEYVNKYIELDTHVLLPHHKDMTHKEVESLNNITKTKKLPIYQNRGGFEPTTNIDVSPNEFTLSSSHLTKKDRRKISQIFFRKNKHGTPYTLLMLTLFLSLLYIFQVFITFEGNKSIKKLDDEFIRVTKMSDQTIQGTLTTSYIYAITDEELDAYYINGYEGNIYPVYNYGFSMGYALSGNGKITRISSIMNYAYVRETTGTICCDEDFLLNLYGKDGKINVLAGNIKDANKKIIITDYVAHSLMVYSKNTLVTYEDVYNKYSNRICAIIDTGYQERYQDILESADKAKEQGIESTDFVNMNATNQEFESFLEEVQNYLSLNYAFCSGDEFLNNVFVRSASSFSISNFYTVTPDNEKLFCDGSYNITCDTKNTYKLNNNEIIMGYTMYKELFGKEYNSLTASTFEPHSFKIMKYGSGFDDSVLLYEQEFVIKSLSTSTFMNETTFSSFEKSRFYPYSLYFTNREFEDVIYDVTEENDFLIHTLDTSIVPVINTIIEIFRGFCILIIILLIVVCVVYLISFGIGTIKKNLYEIGVLKALGTKSIDISVIFITQIVIVGLGVILVSILGIKVFSDFSNKLLIKSFEDFLTIKIFNLKIIPVKPGTMSFDLSLMFAVTLVSSIIPLIYLKALKPLNILKGKKK